MSVLEDRKREFGDHVWNHAVDPFQTQFDERRPLDQREVEAIGRILESLQQPGDVVVAGIVRREIQANPRLMDILLQLAGLTRNKIIVDLKAAVRSGAIKGSVPSSYARLPFTPAWREAGPYLISRLRKVSRTVPNDRRLLPGILEALNQATWPGYIRQERAKRSGHEAEYRLATLLAACGFPFEPQEKAENPLCPDAAVGGVSFDIVVPAVANPQVCVKSTVHTANIGQYGESKDHLEVDEAHRMLDRNFPAGRRPLLLAFVDGVGFESNRAGLEGVLSKADEFCQYRTLWKAIVVIGDRLDRRPRLIIPEAEIPRYRGFLRAKRYLKLVDPLEHVRLPKGAVEAGDGWVILS